MVRPSGIEPLSPGYQPGALPLSYEQVFRKQGYSLLLVGVVGFDPTASRSRSERSSWLSYTPKCTSHSVLRRGMNRVGVVPRRGWPGASAVYGQRGRDRTDDLLCPRQARFHFATRWRPVRESNPHSLTENQRALPLAERDMVTLGGIEPAVSRLRIKRPTISRQRHRRSAAESSRAFSELQSDVLTRAADLVATFGVLPGNRTQPFVRLTGGCRHQSGGEYKVARAEGIEPSRD